MGQAVLVHLRLTDHPLGSDRERAAIFDLEDILSDAIAEHGVGLFDGEEFGGGRQTPSALNWEAAPQRLYPQCLSCSNAQGLGIIRLLPRLRGHQ
jgi:hypothetical protein